MVKFKILQTKSKDLMFMHYDWIKDKFNLKDYDVVYEGDMQFTYDDGINIDDVCECIYRQFNRVTKEDCERLKDFKGHSLSVSDLIMFEHEKDVVHYVDAFGFKTVNYSQL